MKAVVFHDVGDIRLEDGFCRKFWCVGEWG